MFTLDDIVLSIIEPLTNNKEETLPIKVRRKGPVGILCQPQGPGSACQPQGYGAFGQPQSLTSPSPPLKR